MALKKYLFFLILVIFTGIQGDLRGTNHTDDDNGFAGGSGTEEYPWQVATPEQLNLLRQYLGNTHADKHFLQISDIDLGQYPWDEGQGWEPIGTSSDPFFGNYDGDGYVISGLTINRPGSNNVGLWGFTEETAHIQNLGLHNATVNGGNYTVGTLVGFNKGLLSAVHATGNVSGGYRVGGLAGENNPGTIADSYAQVDVGANDGRIGGLVGFNVNGTVSGSYATGDVTAGWYVGGLVGRNLNGNISESYATGNITGSNSVGGLIGDTEGGSVVNSYATGSVTGGGAVGGLIGYLWQTQVSQTYATGNVSGTSWGVGGLIGYRFGGQVNNSYWNTETSGQNTSDGGTAKTTTDMVMSETYTNWNFPDVWNIHEGISYPFLTWQGEAGSHNYPFQYPLILLASPETGGSPKAEPDNEFYQPGMQIWLEARPNDGYNLLNWTNQHGEEISQEEEFQYEMPPYDTELTANFAEIISTFTLVFAIEDPQGNLIHNAVIALNNVEYEQGDYEFEGLEPGLYQYNISAEDFFDKGGDVEVTDHDMEVTVVMQPDDTSADSESIKSLSIYPNPATDIINLEINQASSMPLNICLIDINSGLKVLTKKLSSSAQQHVEISIKDLPAGVYILQLQNRVIAHNRRIVIR